MKNYGTLLRLRNFKRYQKKCYHYNLYQKTKINKININKYINNKV